jgi:hypothetical protein
MALVEGDARVLHLPLQKGEAPLVGLLVVVRSPPVAVVVLGAGLVAPLLGMLRHEHDLSVWGQASLAEIAVVAVGDVEVRSRGAAMHGAVQVR